jgi:hypothetical protein
MATRDKHIFILVDEPAPGSEAVSGCELPRSAVPHSGRTSSDSPDARRGQPGARGGLKGSCAWIAAGGVSVGLVAGLGAGTLLERHTTSDARRVVGTPQVAKTDESRSLRGAMRRHPSLRTPRRPLRSPGRSPVRSGRRTTGSRLMVARPAHLSRTRNVPAQEFSFER